MVHAQYMLNNDDDNNIIITIIIIIIIIIIILLFSHKGDKPLAAVSDFELDFHTYI